MPDLVVLCYHAVSPVWPADLAVTPGALRAQLEKLVRRGYRGATFSESVHEPLTANTVCVTFDDAYASVFTEALPVLSKLGLPATVFAPTDFMGSGAPMSWPGVDRWLDTAYRSELLPMTWDELGLLRERGWEIGSHTRSHPRLTQADPGELDRQLVDSRLALESRLGVPCRSLAYPYGDHDRRVVEATARAGYAAACTLPVRFDAATPLTWPRVGVYHADGPATFALKVSRTVRALRATPLWSAAYGALRALR